MDKVQSLKALGQLYTAYTTSIVDIVESLDECETKNKKRKHWVNPLNTVEKRRKQGDHFNLIREMRNFDEQRFIAHLRMTPQIYDKLLHMVTPLITKSTCFREPIDPGTRLEVTLRYLASGESAASLENQFRLGRSTIPKIINETLPVIIAVLKPKVLPTPKKKDFLNTAEGFWKRWNFPNCIGAIDGKHIAIIAPPNSGSEYFNYKHLHSIIFLAVVDYRYRFTMVDVGTPGRQSDGGVFRVSKIGKQFEENWVDLPPPTNIGNDHEGPRLPFFLIGDEAFGINTYLQRPYPSRSSGKLTESQRIYNYRLSIGRRTSENGFGILAAKFRIFRQPVNVGVKKAEYITLAAACLHNYILMEEAHLKPHQKTYLTESIVDREINGNIIDDDWRKDPDQIHHKQFCDAQPISDDIDERIIEETITNPVAIREELKEFFMHSGNVKWQFNNNIF